MLLLTPLYIIYIKFDISAPLLLFVLLPGVAPCAAHLQPLVAMHSASTSQRPPCHSAWTRLSVRCAAAWAAVLIAQIIM